MARPTSCDGTSAAPSLRRLSSTVWPRQARSSSETGRPLQAFRTPAIALSRLNGSVAPERLSTVSCISSTVVNRFSQLSQRRRRRIAVPSSETRESRTLVSVCRQYGQCILGPPFLSRASADVTLCRRAEVPRDGGVFLWTGGPFPVDDQRSSVGSNPCRCELHVENHNGVTTRCSGNRTSGWRGLARKWAYHFDGVGASS